MASFKEDMKRDTVGKISNELIVKDPDSRDPIELEREMHKEYEQNIFDCIERCKKEFMVPVGSWFYIVVITKREPLMPNVLRHYFFGRRSCPSPDYDQAVYAIDPHKDRIDFIWVIPSRDASYHLRDNALQVSQSERDLLNFVLQFADGTLFKISKKLNGEEIDSPLLAT